MDIRGHDAYKTFDYTEFVNQVFSVVVGAGKSPQDMAKDLGCSYALVYNFFAYKVVGLPTMLVFARYAGLDLYDFVIWQD